MSQVISYQPPKDAKHVLVSGARDFDDWKLFEKKLDKYTFFFDSVIVVHGGQKLNIGWKQWAGADYLASKWAMKNWYTQKIFHADWNRFGKGAGPVRNREMVEFVASVKGVCIFFLKTNGPSPGTRDTIEVARKHKLKMRIVEYEE
jgi:hypothetical protein